MMLGKYTTGFSTDYQQFYDHFRIHIPDCFNFGYDVVDQYAKDEPDKTAMVWCNDEGLEYTFTFAQMKRYSDKAANVFRQQGIGKGDAVLLLLKRRFEYWFCAVALHKLGAILIPATHLLTDKDLAYRNNAASVSMIVAANDAVLLESIERSLPQSPTVKKIAKICGLREGWLDFSAALDQADEYFIPPSGDAMPQNHDVMLLYFTSGTTGMPKMVQHNFTYPLGHIVTALWQNVTPDGLHLSVADTGWAKAGWGKIYGQWILGSAIFVYDMDKFDPLRLLKVVTRHHVTTFCAPPTVYRFLIKQDLSGFDFSHIRDCSTAGEPLNPEVYTRFKEITGLSIREAFGQSETAAILATYPFMESRLGAVGKPSPGHDIALLNEDDQPCEIGVEGEICVRIAQGHPPALFDGYYRDPERTATIFRNGYYHTGDLAWKDEDGYFWFIGRSDDVIKSSGYRIGPFEVESALIEHPAVLECAITAVPDPIRGQIVKATVVLTPSYQPSEELIKELQGHVKRTTAPYKYPRIIEFVNELPKTISGKIRRTDIRQQDRNMRNKPEKKS